MGPIENLFEVITVDYYNLTIRHPQMQYYHALQLAKNWAKLVNFLSNFI